MLAAMSRQRNIAGHRVDHECGVALDAFSSLAAVQPHMLNPPEQTSSNLVFPPDSPIFSQVGVLDSR